MLMLDRVVKGDVFIHNNSRTPFGCLEDVLEEEFSLIKLLSFSNQEVTIGIETLVKEFKFLHIETKQTLEFGVIEV